MLESAPGHAFSRIPLLFRSAKHGGRIEPVSLPPSRPRGRQADERRRQEASRARGQPTAFARVEEERRRRAVEAEAQRAAAETARLDGLSRNAARAARERETAARLQAAAAECEALRARRRALLAEGEEA
jgi:hypothetical protein